MWRHLNPEPPTRAEAIRRLIEKGLGGPLSTRQPNEESAHKASELAATELETLGDKSQSVDEQQRRKRRLLKGPKEFREMRGDQGKGSR